MSFVLLALVQVLFFQCAPVMSTSSDSGARSTLREKVELVS